MNLFMEDTIIHTGWMEGWNKGNSIYLADQWGYDEYGIPKVK